MAIATDIAMAPHKLIDLSANLATTWSGKKMDLSIISPTRSMGPDF